MKITKFPPTTCERLSALADGELDKDELLLLLQACKDDDAAAGSWGMYHMIGDVLRSPSLAAGGSSPAFLQRLNERLEKERTWTVPDPVPAPLKVARREPAANDGIFRWKLAAGFASLTAVAAIAWSSVAMISSPSGAQLAQAPAVNQSTPAVLVVASPQGPMVRDARLEELLAAHRQLGGASVLQAPSGFLNAAFETPQNAGR
ncbi:MAG: sigma-E factor negative regulatory protein [Polaromonas sp.]|uniref:sigma-E factor negative regulatory protein n=1 Tax=Polaromonas sp. TaxID=1869339 RepID=UPI0025F91AF3|nr:sigma-E factor negative regulatory protein [Polaromonas sp.]MBI2728664.1 sigma-E factor negative regulatory protein [Polaromonas sp.]